MGDIIRIGKISTIDYAAGTASVTYTDRNNETSPSFPLFSFVYEMPKIGETAVVIMLPNSTTKGFILGVPFGEKKIPAESGQGIFYKEFQDGTSIIYDPKTKTLSVDASKITLKDVTADRLTVEGKITAKEMKAESAEFGTLTAENVTVNASASFKDLSVSGTATINNLSVSGTASGHFPN